MSFRLDKLKIWLKSILNNEFEIKALEADASFRRYYRIYLLNGKTFIVMDAPPNKEKPEIFFRVSRLMQKYNLNVPNCFEYEQEMGFILLSDFGDKQLFNFILEKDLCNELYKKAIFTLIDLLKIDNNLVPNYEYSKLCSEMDLMNEWFFKFIDYIPSCEFKNSFCKLKYFLSSQMLLQPQVFVYRDFHSKNIMILENENNKLGLIDFQDAVSGPLSYDLVSLLKDCYVSLSQNEINNLVTLYYDNLPNDIKSKISLEKFNSWFDFSGLQRHIKCLGIFTRLSLKQERNNYLQHLQRTLNYITDVLKKYPEFKNFYSLWKREILENEILKEKLSIM